MGGIGAGSGNSFIDCIGVWAVILRWPILIFAAVTIVWLLKPRKELR